MVGGPVFMEHPQLAAMVGADATASSGSEAVRQANHLVSLSAREL
jgi:methanogenic corrinoid protein MtbC1